MREGRLALLRCLHGAVLKHGKVFLDRVDFSGELSILMSGGDLQLTLVVTTLHSYLRNTTNELLLFKYHYCHYNSLCFIIS